MSLKNASPSIPLPCCTTDLFMSKVCGITLKMFAIPALTLHVNAVQTRNFDSGLSFEYWFHAANLFCLEHTWMCC